MKIDFSYRGVAEGVRQMTYEEVLHFTTTMRFFLPSGARANQQQLADALLKASHAVVEMAEEQRKMEFKAQLHDVHPDLGKCHGKK